MGLQFARLTQEVAYNTFPGSPAAGTQLNMYLPTDGDMSVRVKPMWSDIRDAGFGNRLIRRISGRQSVGGSLNSYLFPSQTGFILGLASGAVVAGTGGIPAGSSAPCLDIPSFAIDHLIDRDFDCGKEYRRYTGNKVQKLSLKSSSSQDGWLWSFDMDILGSTPRTITVSDYATPAISAYPADDPYQFFQTAGYVSINSGTRTNYTSLSLEIDNTLEAFADESIYASDVKWHGRTVTFSIEGRYKSPADRLLYEAGTKIPASIEINNGTHTLTLNFGTQCVINEVTDTLPMGGMFRQRLTITALMDASLTPATDFSFTVT